MTGRTAWTPAEARLLAAFADHGDIVLSVREQDPFWASTDEDFEGLERPAFGPVVRVLVDNRDDVAVSRFIARWNEVTAAGELSDMRVMIHLTDPTDAPASPEPPRGAVSSGTDGTPPPAVPAAPRGPLTDDPDRRPADPEWWDAERDASFARSGMLGALLIVLAGCVVVGAVAALVWAVAR